MEFDLGFLGGGQLARMSIQAAQRMGLKCCSLDPDPNSPASQVANSICGALDSSEAIAELLAKCRRVTFENEFIPVASIREAMETTQFHPENMVPRVEVLEVIQDKLAQRTALARAGVPGPNAREAEVGVEPYSYPAVYKSRVGGYDGKGVRFVTNAIEKGILNDTLAKGGWMEEQRVDFRRELAVMVATDGKEFRVYPVVETVQIDGVCDTTMPVAVDATTIATEAVKAVAGSSPGLFGVELFQLANGQLTVNEIAPRPHNTGHYTLDNGQCSQFEMHVRIAMELPMPTVGRGIPTAMVNLLGQQSVGDFRDAIGNALDQGVHFHWYGKAASKPGRKMGHINAQAHTPEAALEKAKAAQAAFYKAWSK